MDKAFPDDHFLCHSLGHRQTMAAPAGAGTLATHPNKDRSRSKRQAPSPRPASEDIANKCVMASPRPSSNREVLSKMVLPPISKSATSEDHLGDKASAEFDAMMISILNRYARNGTTHVRCTDANRVGGSDRVCVLS